MKQIQQQQGNTHFDLRDPRVGLFGHSEQLGGPSEVSTNQNRSMSFRAHLAQMVLELLELSRDGRDGDQVEPVAEKAGVVKLILPSWKLAVRSEGEPASGENGMYDDAPHTAREHECVVLKVPPCCFRAGHVARQWSLALKRGGS